jgi:hypothetical protein
MARREVISVRVDEGTAQAIDQVRGSASRAKWVEGLISDTLEDGPARLMAGEEMIPASKVREAGACNHPRARVIKGFCYRCGSMVLK